MHAGQEACLPAVVPWKRDLQAEREEDVGAEHRQPHDAKREVLQPRLDALHVPVVLRPRQLPLRLLPLHSTTRCKLARCGGAGSSCSVAHTLSFVPGGGPIAGGGLVNACTWGPGVVNICHVCMCRKVHSYVHSIMSDCKTACAHSRDGRTCALPLEF